MATQFTPNLLTPNLLRSKNDTDLMSLTLMELYLKKAEAVDVEDYDTAKHIKGVIEKKKEELLLPAPAPLPPPGAPLAYWTDEVHNQMETAYEKFINLAWDYSGTFNEKFLYPLLNEGLPGLLEYFASPYEAILGVIMAYIQVEHYDNGYYEGAVPWPCFLNKLLESGAGDEQGSWPLARLVYQQIARARSGADMFSLMKSAGGRFALTKQIAAAYNDLTVTPEDKMVLLREYTAEKEDIEAEVEEFTHEGETLFKMADEENEGCFLILNRSPGGEEDEYEQWGTMDADGNITKDDE